MADSKELKEWKQYWYKKATTSKYPTMEEWFKSGWKGHELEYHIMETFKWRIVERIRKRRNDPKWVPTGVLSGGAWLVDTAAKIRAKRYMRLYKVENP